MNATSELFPGARISWHLQVVQVAPNYGPLSASQIGSISGLFMGRVKTSRNSRGSGRVRVDPTREV